MKKVFVTYKADEKQKERFSALADEYEFVYKEDKDANIVIGNYPIEKLKEFEKLEWIQTGAVGVDKYIRKGALRDGVILTNAVDVHSQEVAEHIFATITAMIKKLYLYRDDQYEHKWTDEGPVKEYKNLKVAIVGFGNIAKVLCQLLKPLGVYIIGVKRTVSEKPDYVDELYTDKDLKKAISDVDVVVSVLPGNKANEYLFDLDTFKAMRRDCVFINAGRGNLYRYEVLKEVLDKKIIEAVASDVFESEPLDRNSDLWNYRNMIITPHIAGSFHLYSAAERFVALSIDNLKRYAKGEELRNVVTERD